MAYLYLMRHAKAESAGTNPKRPLSPYGIRQIASSASLARAGGRPLEVPSEILHSSKERARETAALLARSLGWSSPLREHKGLDPDAEPELLNTELQALEGTLAVVGHLPFLPHLASLLIPKEDFSFNEATLRFFSKDKKGWKEEWFVEPRPPDPRKGE